LFREFTIHIFESISFLQGIDKIDESEIEKRKIFLPYKKDFKRKRSIIFDLDETLAHCTKKPSKENPPDVVLPIKLKNGQIFNAGFNIRPLTQECLKLANEHYEVIVFTASH